jgi:putative alpha-1,2-mannosidase
MQKLIVAVLLAGSSVFAGSHPDPAAMVNPFLGSGGNPLSSGNTFPGATTPFGYVRLSPDTRYPPALFAVMPGTSNAGKSGYFWGHTRLTGFSHTRLQGAGVREGGFFRVLPLRARHVQNPSRRTRETAFRHEQEVASPGYYGLTIPHEGLKAELTASPRCGFHRYTPLKADSAIDVWVQSDTKISKHGKPMSGALTLLPERHAVFGETEMKSDVAMHYGGLVAYFYAEFTAGTEASLFEEKSWASGVEARGKESGLRLSSRGKTIEPPGSHPKMGALGASHSLRQYT